MGLFAYDLTEEGMTFWGGLKRNIKQKERKMTKAEALRKMEELREFIEECDKRPRVKLGQLWGQEDGYVYLVCYTVHGLVEDGCFDLVSIKSNSPGTFWNMGNGFGMSRDAFKYLGMASDLIQIKQ